MNEGAFETAMHDPSVADSLPGRRRRMLRLPPRFFAIGSRKPDKTKLDPAPLHRHAAYEDTLAILAGTLLVSLGIVVFIRTNLITGGVAGLSLLLERETHIGFWYLFFVLSLPFYWFSWKKQGVATVTRTFVAVALECVLSRLTVAWLGFSFIDPLYAAIIAGLLIGTGVLMLYRHSTSLGGVGILSVYLQDTAGIRAGYVQLGADLALLSAAALFMPLRQVLLSVVAALVTNGFVAINHRPGRYAGFT